MNPDFLKFVFHEKACVFVILVYGYDITVETRFGAPDVKDRRWECILIVNAPISNFLV